MTFAAAMIFLWTASKLSLILVIFKRFQRLFWVNENSVFFDI